MADKTDKDALDAMLASWYGDLASNPDFLKEQANIAAPRPFPGDPSLYQGDITNPGERPYDRFARPIAESISPTLGGYGMGQLAAETYKHASEGEYGKAAETGLPMALGIFAGPGAKTANLEALALAQRLAKKGASRETIWSDTGWFQGPDQKWRFEIPDNAAGPVNYEQFLPQGKAVQHEFLPHPELYEAYPAAQYSKVSRVDEPGASFNPENYNIEIGTDYLTKHPGGYWSARSEGVKSQNLHELQHLVQTKEGFAPGSNPSFGHKKADVQESARRAYERELAMADPDAELLRELGVEVPQWMIDKTPWDKLTPRQQLEHYDRGRRLLYQNSAGEVEARNVQHRMQMTPEQRKLTPPWETEDVPSVDQILSKEYKGGPQMSIGKDSIGSGDPPESAGALTPSQPSVPVEAGSQGIRAYHATQSPKDFSKFRRKLSDVGIHFGTADQANSRVSYLAERGKPEDGMRVFPVDLDIKNPLRLDDPGHWDADNLAYELRKAVLKDPTLPFSVEEISELTRRGHPNSQLAALRDLIHSRGYDGIVYKNTGESHGPEALALEKASYEAEKAKNAVFGSGKAYYNKEEQAHPAYKAWTEAMERHHQYMRDHGADSYIATKKGTVKSATTGESLYAHGGSVETPPPNQDRFRMRPPESPYYLEDMQLDTENEMRRRQGLPPKKGPPFNAPVPKKGNLISGE